MRLLFTSIILLISLCSFSDNWVSIKTDNHKKIYYEVLETDESHTVIQFKIGGFDNNAIETPRGKASVISIPNMVSLCEKGAPDLPKFALSMVIGDYDLMELRVLSAEFEEYSDIDIAPSKGDFSRQIDPASVPYSYSSLYEQNAFYPDVRAKLEQPYILRNHRGQVITVMPFAYNPITRTLRVYYNLTIEAYKAGIGGVNLLSRVKHKQTEDYEFMNLYSRQFVNYENVQNRYPVLEEQGALLVLSDQQFMEAMQPFVEWKNTIGRPTEMIDVASIGSTPESIKEFVTDYYNNHGLTHLLLVGDHQHIPSYYISNSGGYSDNYYGYLEGDDSYNELFVGRFSVETVAHVQTMVQRVISYERDFNQTAEWLAIGTGVARNEGAGSGHNGGEADYVHIDFIRDSLLNYTYQVVHREYDGNVPGVPNTTAEQISQRINEGTSIINYCNHGSQNSWSVANYSSTHVNALTNTDRWPIIWAVACDNGRFTDGTCFAEAWTRASYNGQPTGAIGTKMSWISQPWLAPMTGQDEMVTILVEGYTDNIKRTLGGLSTNGGMRMIDLHGSSGISTHDTWILFGDPTLTLRTKPPTEMTVSHISVLHLGMDEMVVNADAEGATVALTINGEILGTGVVTNGSASISFPPVTNIGTLKIAVFGYNKVTYLNEIEILPATGPFVAFVSSTIDGLPSNSVHYGSEAILGIQVRNFGVENASNVQISLSSSSPYVDVIDDIAEYGTLLPNQQILIEDAFAFNLSDKVPDKMVLPFQLHIIADEGSWVADFNLIALAPEFEITKLRIDDEAGNGNRRLDPGETVDLKATIINIGNSNAHDVTSFLTCSSPFIQINLSEYSIGYMPFGQTSEALFSITVAEETPVGTIIEFEINVTAGEYTAQNIFLSKIGLMVEDFESGGFTDFAWVNGGNQPWVITNVDAYEGEFSAKSGPISHSQSSQLMLQYESNVDDTISFYRKVSSESGFDKLHFYMDATKMDEWTGDIKWAKVSYPVPAGNHVFKWVYLKDANGSNGDDCAWLDYIVFPLNLNTFGWAGEDAAICSGESYQLNASAAVCDSVLWSTSGTGVFSNASIINPVYTPSEQDNEQGGVILTLSVYGNATLMESSMQLIIHALPIVSITGDPHVCEGDAATIIVTMTGKSPWIVDVQNMESIIAMETPWDQSVYPESTTTYQLIQVTDGNNCINLAEGYHQIIVDQLPMQAVKPITPDTIDHAIHVQSPVSVDSVVGATSYIWKIEPSEAGTISGNTADAMINWNTEFIGIASVQVTAVNICGHGEWSEASEVIVHSTIGTDERFAATLYVYPNPTDGQLTIILDDLQNTFSLCLYNILGELVYTKEFLDVGVATQILSLGHLPGGIYLMKVSSASTVKNQRILIRK